MLRFALPSRPGAGLAAKVLGPSLTVSLLVAAVMYVTFTAKFARQAEEDLRTRLESLINAQAAELEGPVWEFDQATIDRLFRSYGANPNLQYIRLVDASGRILAQAGASPPRGARPIAASRVLTHRSGGETYTIARLEEAYHDERIRQVLAGRLAADLPAAAALVLLLVGGLSLTVSWCIGAPLSRLRESLTRNRETGKREPLAWSSGDEIGQVVAAYNSLLAEIDEHTGTLERANAELEEEVKRRRQAQKRLSLFSMAVDATDAAMAITDHELTVLEVNAACLRITDFSASELVGRSARETFLAASEHTLRAMGEAIARRGAWSGECPGLSGSGRAMPLRLSANALPSDDAALGQMVLVFSDATKVKATEELLKNLAYRDTLTALPNRALFMDRLEREIAFCSRRGRGFALLFVDLDNFKCVNDSLSHSVGDQTLSLMAGRMRRCLRGEDMLARMGGDEFTVILRETTEAQAVARVAAKLVAAAAEPLDVAGTRLEVGASVGVAFFPEDGQDSDALMRNADTAMYTAKSEGGGRVRFFEPAIAEQAKARLDLKNSLRQAIAEKAFVLRYQPIISMTSGEVEHFEALVRWNRDGGLIGPAQFIPFAEETGLITPIGQLILDMAFDQLRAWQAAGTPARVAVNISRNQFADEDFAEDCIRRAEAFGVDPARVLLELTETMIMADPLAARSILDRLIGHGFRVAVDDFGVGYSSLSVLVEYPVHSVKLDKSLITGLDHDARARAMVSGFISLFQRLGLEVVAEGVETALQHEFLSATGCDLAQGWFYGKPMSPEDVGGPTPRGPWRRSRPGRDALPPPFLKQ